jgi:hypothetical protein
MAHPLHTNGLADGLRQQQRVGGDVIRAVGAVGSGTVEKNDAQLLQRDAEHFREICAQAVRPL